MSQETGMPYASGRDRFWDQFSAFGFFVLMGSGSSAWISRLPSIKAALGLSPSQLALMTVLGGIGSVAGLITSGVITSSAGTRQAMALAGGVWTVGTLIVAYALSLHRVAYVVVGLFFTSAALCLWGTVMNVQAGVVQKRVGKPIMSRFHASYSIGMLVALAVGSFLSHHQVSPAAHLAGNALFTLLALLACVLVCPRSTPASETGQPELVDELLTSEVGQSQPGKQPAQPAQPRQRGRLGQAFVKQARAWVDPVVLMLAVIDIGLETSEGAVNDWSAIGIVDSFGASESFATLAPTVFTIVMIVTRLIGPWALERWGNQRMLYATLLVSVAGTALYALAPTALLALAGTGLWGMGAALGVPIVMTYATADPAMAAQRTSVISSANYGASWVFPPALGFIADHAGVQHSILTISLVLFLAVWFVSKVSPSAR